MVSKDVSFLGFLLPVAMIVGTCLAIYFYKSSISYMLVVIAFEGLLFCGYILSIRSKTYKKCV
jgi:hypothetical protein